MFSLIHYSVSAGQNDLLRRVGHVWTWKHFDSFSLSPCKSLKNFPQPSPQVFLSSQETFPFSCIISAALQDTPCAIPLLFFSGVSSLCETRQAAAYPDEKGLALCQSEANSRGIFTTGFFVSGIRRQGDIQAYDGDFWPWLCYDSLSDF